MILIEIVRTFFFSNAFRSSNFEVLLGKKIVLINIFKTGNTSISKLPTARRFHGKIEKLQAAASCEELMIV